MLAIFPLTDFFFARGKPNKAFFVYKCITSQYMDQKIINLYDEYTHRCISRKDFMKKLAVLTGSTALALSVLPLLENNYAAAASVNEEELETGTITYKGADGDIKAFLA